MTKVLITGSTGFVGKNLIKYIDPKLFSILSSSVRYGMEIDIKDANAVIHLSGKVHDIKNVSGTNIYYQSNYFLAQKVFDAFLASDANVFIFLSSVKAVADTVLGELTETALPSPQTDYGKSKLQAEEYILNKFLPKGKRVYILRPCMIHGPENKGNLNLLFDMVRRGIPYPLASFENQRSFLSVENLCFVIRELIERTDIPSGIYNVADDIPLSTNRVIQIMSETILKRPRLWRINKRFIKRIARIGDFLPLPLNSERLQKLTESYVVSNAKLLTALKKSLPVSSEEGLRKTIQSFADGK